MKSNHILLLLIVCGALAVVLTVGGGVTLYSSSMRSVEVTHWIEHTHSVLDALNTEQIRLERTDYNLQLYQANQQTRNLRDAQNSSAALQSGVAELQHLVADNASQTKHGRELEVAVLALTSAIAERSLARSEQRLASVSLPPMLFDNCRLTLSADADRRAGPAQPAAGRV